MLPHLRGRPLTLERFPEGLEGESFYQKNASSYFPEWLRTYRMPTRKEGRNVDYVLVDDAAGLLYLVNQGAITFHAFLSRVESLQKPDFMLVDIDPPDGGDGRRGGAGPSAAHRSSKDPLARAIEVAFLLREEFLASGMELFVKLSGKRGLHLAFPLAGSMSYSEAREWLTAFLGQIAKAHSDLLTMESRKNRRSGRVYLDATRMTLGATIVPPYVVRATPQATVSAPVTWEELRNGITPDDLTIRKLPERARRLGDLWAALAPAE